MSVGCVSDSCVVSGYAVCLIPLLSVYDGVPDLAVRTGKFRDGDEKRGERPPDETHASFASWVEHFISGELNNKP